MATLQSTKEIPLVVLVYEPSLLRMWMERSLGKLFRVCAFSTAEDALAFVRSTVTLDVLITDLDLGLSAIGGCNIARDVEQKFPQSRIFVFSDTPANDHRLLILRGMKKVKYLTKPFGAFFLSRHVVAELAHNSKGKSA